MNSHSQIKQWIHWWHNQSEKPICAYVYDLEGIRSHVKNMLSTMPKQTSLFYAIKANPDKKIIEALLPLVKGFEVASIGELLLVRKISESVPILFGGPGKKDDELEMAIRTNVAYIHVESLLELRKIILLAKSWSRHIRILLRINLRTNTLPQTKISMGGKPSQFGLDEAFIEEAIAILRESDNQYVHFSGFHFHSLSNNLQAELHVEMIQFYLQKVEKWKRSYGIDVQVVNAGGGFGVSYDDKPGFDWQLFTSLLAESEGLRALGETQLFFEPGRFIVADYGFYVAEVVDIKQSQDEFFAVLRGGTHHNRLPASWEHNHPFCVVPTTRWPYPFQRTEINNAKVTIVGELCTPKDRLHTDAELEQLRVGDVLLFEKSGAYCWTISHHDFLGHPHPKFYYITEGN
ncbi:type III PLP-dependent enzyme [Paenibacillus psychroresistens]|uniref:Type III PLP-dependent enzyme n=1 Tax=Paenibacillus psychroresistens TaxID=1778678 RepID=A0A6B8RRT6_9BACL|nr:type III PLP-dependent enzyme [Paenibacillus psychroresistens]QGQ99111.1 type III PLP-dependent enzyme [Paenibacillus psychroresistens]